MAGNVDTNTLNTHRTANIAHSGIQWYDSVVGQNVESVRGQR